MLSICVELLITALCSASTEEGQAAENAFFAGRKWKIREKLVEENGRELVEIGNRKLWFRCRLQSGDGLLHCAEECLNIPCRLRVR